MDRLGQGHRTRSSGAPPNSPSPLAPSDSKSEVGVSNTELPSPHQIVSKVCQVDDVEHTLNKGLWVGTGATRQGWKIFIKVNFFLTFSLWLSY